MGGGVTWGLVFDVRGKFWTDEVEEILRYMLVKPMIFIARMANKRMDWGEILRREMILFSILIQCTIIHAYDWLDERHCRGGRGGGFDGRVIKFCGKSVYNSW